MAEEKKITRGGFFRQLGTYALGGAGLIYLPRCAEESGSSESTPTSNVNPDPVADPIPQPGDNPSFPYDNDNHTPYFFTGLGIEQIQDGEIIMGMTIGQFVNRYNNDLNPLVKNMWRPSVAALNPGQTDTNFLDGEVDKWMDGLANPNLPNVKSGNAVLFGRHDYGAGPEAVIQMYFDEKDTNLLNANGLFTLRDNAPNIKTGAAMPGVDQIVTQIEANLYGN